jgi:CopG-like RHH_1 or ribbon-helix-helix domain, RHH_5
VSGTVSRRVFLTLPDQIADDLERWAEAEGTKAASLAGFIVGRAIRDAKLEGRIPPESAGAQPDFKKFHHVVLHYMGKLVESGKFPNGRLKELMGGQPPTEVELLRVALICGLTEEYLASLPINGESRSDAASRAK